VNRQPRTLLTLLLVAAIGGTAFFLWRDLQTPPPGTTGGLLGADVPPARGGRITVTARAEPRSFNRLVSGHAITEVFA
jgi:hypothetical protein